MGQFQYFGIEYVAECWSGAGGNLTYSKYGPSSQCVNGLGGDESLYVYKFNSPRKSNLVLNFYYSQRSPIGTL
jgi:hypothetical protein